jgi:hypothetical protein
VLKVVAQEGTEPKFIPAGIGRVVGLCVDLFRAIESIEPGVQFVGDQQWLPPLRAHSELATHEHDALCAVQHRGTQRQYVFLDPALFQLRYQLIARPTTGRHQQLGRCASWRVRHHPDQPRLRRAGAAGAHRRPAGRCQRHQPGHQPAKAGGRTRPLSCTARPACKALSSIRRGQQGHDPAGRDGHHRRLRPGTHVDPAVRQRVQRAIEQLEKSGEWRAC